MYVMLNIGVWVHLEQYLIMKKFYRKLENNLYYGI